MPQRITYAVGRGRAMDLGECRRTRRGVTYCRLRIGTRFCPKGTTTAEECEAGIGISGDRRRGRFVRRRVAAPIEAYFP